MISGVQDTISDAQDMISDVQVAGALDYPKTGRESHSIKYKLVINSKKGIWSFEI